MSFQYSTSTAKETPFRSQIDYIKRPRANKHAKEIITLVLFRTLFVKCRLIRLKHMDTLESNALFSIIRYC